MRTRMRCLIVSGAMTLALALAGCSSNGGTGLDDPTNTAPAEPTVVSTTQAAPEPQPTTPSSELPHVSTLDFADDGYQLQLTIEQGDLTVPNDAMTNGDVKLSGCDLEPAYDAVVPYIVRVTNKTPGVPVRLKVAWATERKGGLGTAVRSRVHMVETYTVGGSQECIDEYKRSDLFTSIKSNNAIQPDESMTIHGYIIWHKYYNPSHPKGDNESVRHAILGVIAVTADDHILSWSKPEGGMKQVYKLNHVRYGVSIVPSETSKNCLLNKKVTCP